MRTFHISRIRAGMTWYKKASPGTMVVVADRDIPPADGFGTIEVGLDQPDATITPSSEDDCRRVCARTFMEPDVHPQSNKTLA